MDGSILAGNIANARRTRPTSSIVGEVLNVEPIAIMIRKDDAGLKKLGNDVIAGLVKSGEMDKLWDKWFLQPIPPKNIKVGLPLSESTKAGLGQPERQADGRLRQEVISGVTPEDPVRAPWAGVLLLEGSPVKMQRDKKRRSAWPGTGRSSAGRRPPVKRWSVASAGAVTRPT